MNVLLVYPEFPNTFWSYTHALRVIRKKAVMPPLGLLTVAALLPGPWGKRLVDLNVRALTADDLAWADCVFVGAMAAQREAARRVIAQAKAAGKRVVAGGPLFTGEYALFEQVDHFALNEGELTIPPLAADLERGCAKRTYRSRRYADLHQSPVPMWELADLDQYACASVQFSRGCPFACEFCNVTALLGREPRTKSAEQVIAELDALHARGWRGPVFFVDDNLIGNKRQVKTELLPALIDWQRRRGPMPFNTQASINLADDEALVGDMVRAGFDTVFVGIETPEAESLTECHKNQNSGRDLVADVKRLQRAGLEVQAGFIVGFDHDTESTFQRQADFIQRSGIVTAMVGMLHAPPGTRLAERLWREGRLLGPSSGDNTDGSTNIVPKMGLELLQQGYRRLLKQIYSPEPLYRRIKSFLREYRPAEVRLAIDGARVRALLRSMYQLGVVGEERVQYWMLLLWVLLRRPRILPAAVRLAVCGHHLRKISQLQFDTEASAGAGT